MLGLSPNGVLATESSYPDMAQVLYGISFQGQAMGECLCFVGSVSVAGPFFHYE